MVMEWEGSCIVPLVKVKNKEGHAHLSAMKMVKVLIKGELTFLATITRSSEDNGTIESLPPLIKKVL